MCINEITVNDLQDPAIRVQVCRRLETVLGGAYHIESASLDDRMPSLLLSHRSTGLPFVFIPSGSFQMGLSPAEEMAARRIKNPPPLDVAEMRPIQERRVG